MVLRTKIRVLVVVLLIFDAPKYSGTRSYRCRGELHELVSESCLLLNGRTDFSKGLLFYV